MIKNLLIIIGIIFLAAQCPDKPCPQCPDPTQETCDSLYPCPECDTCICPECPPCLPDTVIEYYPEYIHDTVLKPEPYPIYIHDTIKITKDSIIYLDRYSAFRIDDNGQVFYNNGLDTLWLPVLNQTEFDYFYNATEMIHFRIEIEEDTLIPPVIDSPTFESNFEDVAFNGTHLTGEWIDFVNRPDITDFFFNFNGSSSYAHAEIRTDPTDSNNKVLYGEVHGDDPNQAGYSRFQGAATMYNYDIVHDTFRISYDVLWNEDIGKIEGTSQGLGWFNLLEFWERYNSNLDGNTNGQACWVLRWSRLASGGPIRWRMCAIRFQPSSDGSFWNDVYSDIPIPFGEWCNLDFTFIRGQGTEGRILLKITPRNTGVTQTIFDIHNYTEYPSNSLPIWQFHFFKLYSDPSIYTFFQNNGWIIDAYYDNVKLWLK